MLSRLLDPRDGKPRHPVFWLVVSALVATQLLALYVLCTNQVRKAQDRRAEVHQQVASMECAQHGIADCAAAYVPAARRSSVQGADLSASSLR